MKLCWLTVFALCVVLVLAASTAAQQCPEPEDLCAVELVVSVQGARLNPHALTCAMEAAPGVYAYRSGFDERVVVLLYYSSAPPLGASFPTVRFQVPLEGGKPLFNVSSGDLCRVAMLELQRLSDERVLEGVSKELLRSFGGACSAGRAGWDYRLVWHNGTWVSYLQVPGAVPLSACRAPIPLKPNELPVCPAPGLSVSTAAVSALIIAAVAAAALLAGKKIRASTASVTDRDG